ncbi:MAG: phosphotransferase [Patescibacteria group bacterium]|mgnify:FL=1
MIKVFEKAIREHASEYFSVNASFSFLKYSTVTSGALLKDKVIFLVFKNRDQIPFLCIKTVRNYEAKEAITRNFSNLKKLNSLTEGSPYERLFAKALYFHDDGENVFCIETACPGRRLSKDKDKLAVVVKGYVGFQEYAAKSDGFYLRSMEQLAKEAVINSGLNQKEQMGLLAYVETLPFSDIKLPRIIQHGDLTLDNILFSQKGLGIIDYDFVGNTDIPGFDLFGLFRRFDRTLLSKLLTEYFPTYFEKIGSKYSSHDNRRLIFLYHLIEHTQGRMHTEEVSVERIISDFERLYHLP